MMKKLITGMLSAALIAGVLAVGVSAQDATPEVTPAPEMTPEATAPRPFLGIGMNTDAELNNGGVLIVEVLPGSPAQTAGLQIDDVITAINDLAVTTPEALSTILLAQAVGDTVTLTVQRGDETLTLAITLAAFPEELRQPAQPPLSIIPLPFGGERGDQMPDSRIPEGLLPFGMGPGMGGFFQNGRLGAAFITLDEQVARERDAELTEGALITAVEADSPAAVAGLQENDIVTAVNAEAVNAEITLRDRLIAYEPGDEVVLTVQRDGETLELTVIMGQPQQLTLEMLPFGENDGCGSGNGGRGGLGDLLPPGHPPIPVPPTNPGST